MKQTLRIILIGVAIMLLVLSALQPPRANAQADNPPPKWEVTGASYLMWVQYPQNTKPRTAADVYAGAILDFTQDITQCSPQSTDHDDVSAAVRDTLTRLTTQELRYFQTTRAAELILRALVEHWPCDSDGKPKPMQHEPLTREQLKVTT